jgi:alpha-beta hydrolase superfamily lysophospholipase
VTRTRTAARVALVVLAMMGIVLGLLWTLQRQLIYLPSRGPVPPAAALLEHARDVRLRTSDGLELGAWFVPATPRGSGVTVLVANGNAGERSIRAPLAQALADRGLGVLLFDYRGYGGNPGSPSEEGLARDVRAAHQFLIGEARVPPDRLLYYGESLGAAVVTELATDHPPAGIVLRSPFVDLASVGRIHYPFLPVRLLLRDRYPVAEQLATVTVPTTVVYGTADSIVPPQQSQAVAAAAGGPVRLVPVHGANHNDMSLLDGAELVNAIVDLATQVAPNGP